MEGFKASRVFAQITGINIVEFTFDFVDECEFAFMGLILVLGRVLKAHFFTPLFFTADFFTADFFTADFLAGAFLAVDFFGAAF